MSTPSSASLPGPSLYPVSHKNVPSHKHPFPLVDYRHDPSYTKFCFFLVIKRTKPPPSSNRPVYKRCSHSGPLLYAAPPCNSLQFLKINREKCPLLASAFLLPSSRPPPINSHLSHPEPLTLGSPPPLLSRPSSPPGFPSYHRLGLDHFPSQPRRYLPSVSFAG